MAFTGTRRLPEHMPQREMQSIEHRTSSYVPGGRGERKRALESLSYVIGYYRSKLEEESAVTLLRLGRIRLSLLEACCMGKIFFQLKKMRNNYVFPMLEIARKGVKVLEIWDRLSEKAPNRKLAGTAIARFIGPEIHEA